MPSTGSVDGTHAGAHTDTLEPAKSAALEKIQEMLRGIWSLIADPEVASDYQNLCASNAHATCILSVLSFACMKVVEFVVILCGSFSIASLAFLVTTAIIGLAVHIAHARGLSHSGGVNASTGITVAVAWSVYGFTARHAILHAGGSGNNFFSVADMFFCMPQIMIVILKLPREQTVIVLSSHFVFNTSVYVGTVVGAGMHVIAAVPVVALHGLFTLLCACASLIFAAVATKASSMGKEIDKHRDESRSVLEAFKSMFESMFDCIAYTDATMSMKVIGSSGNLEEVFGSSIVGKPLLCYASSVSDFWPIFESVRTMIEQSQTMASTAPKTVSKLSMSFRRASGEPFQASVHVCWMPGDTESDQNPSMAFGLRFQEKGEVQTSDSSEALVQASGDHLMDVPKEKKEYPERGPGTSNSTRVVQGGAKDQEEEEDDIEEEEECVQQEQNVEQKMDAQMQAQQIAPSLFEATVYHPKPFEHSGNTAAASSNSVVLRPGNQGFDIRNINDPPLVLPMGKHRNSGGFMPPGHREPGMVGPFSKSSQEEAGRTGDGRDRFTMVQPSDAQSAAGSTRYCQDSTLPEPAMDRAPGIIQVGYMDPVHTNPEYTSPGYSNLTSPQPEAMPTAPAMPPLPNMKWNSSPMSAPADIHPTLFMDQTQPIPSPPGVVSPPPGIFPQSSMTQEEPSAASVGSVGHPHSCGPPCKFQHTPRSCKDGEFCTHCHVCPWRKLRRRRAPEVEQVATINPTRTTESGPVWAQPSAQTANAMSAMSGAAGGGFSVHRPQGAEGMQYPSDGPSYINMQGFAEDGIDSIKVATLESISGQIDLGEQARIRNTFLHFDETGSSAFESAVRATRYSRSCVSEPTFVMQTRPGT